MQLFALGLNHTTAPVEIREQINFTPDRLKQALPDLIERELAQEVVILSTCNRTELYCVLDCDTTQAIITWLSHYHNVPLQHLQDYLYTYS